jgi:galactose oxidase-like protein
VFSDSHSGLGFPTRSRFLFPTLSTLAIAVCLWPCSPAHAYLGQWSPPDATLGFTEVHMALLPGTGSSHHSRILTWGTGYGSNDGAELGWDPGTADCGTWPFSLASLGTWGPGANIFCAGHAQLSDGKLFTAGGDDVVTNWGLPDARTFEPSSPNNPWVWMPRPLMQQSRFYPTATTLRDGRVLVTGGQRYSHLWFYGGRVNGAAPSSGTGDLLHRFGRGTGGIWDPAVTPSAMLPEYRPTAREGHTATRIELSSSDVAQAFFGGQDNAGRTLDNQVYLLRRQDGAPLDADYGYAWTRLPTAGQPPDPRSGHTAVNFVSAPSGTPSSMAIYGGLSQPTSGPATVLGDFWKLSKNAQNQWAWSPLPVSGGPGPRYGHAAVSTFYGDRMYIFGGASQPNAEATDPVVYVFKVSDNTWSPLSAAANSGPAPRREHTMVLDPNPTGAAHLFVYSGTLKGNVSSDTLWVGTLSSSSVAWSFVAPTGSQITPGPRAGHAGYYDALANRLFIFGGEPAPSAAVDKFVYSIDPFRVPYYGTPQWVRGPEAPYRLSGHTADGDPAVGLHARVPEVFNPTNNAWSVQSNSGWLPPVGLSAEYPVQFLVPGSAVPAGGGRVIRVGQDPITRYLDIPASGLAGNWLDVVHGNNGLFQPQTGVQYVPGKLLVTGPGSATSASAKTMDTEVIETAEWQNRPGMLSRVNHNMVLLPNGQVLALGGEGIKCPQLWTPSTGTWTSGSPSCDLEPEPVFRGYHSSAMLLPDGRVLTGGGDSGEGNDGTKLFVFCPPYLFNGSCLALRPTITSAPASVVYGESFVIGKANLDQISSVCLIRPAAVTHSFDQNGRYVPLTFETETSTALRVFAPTSGSAAPPGDYLLFILNSSGVPAIARWVHLGSNCTVVPCDTDSPPRVNDLYVDIVGPNEIWLAWSAPGDDRDPALGAYDVRYSASPIASELAFDGATPVGGQYAPPVPGPHGSGQSCAKLGLSSCTPYYFALKTRDGVFNWSLKATLAASTTCDGGGGTFSAHRTGGELADAAGAPVVAGPADATAASADSRPATGTLVTQTRLLAGGGWQVSLHYATEADGLDPASADITVDQLSASGGRDALGRFTPEASANLLGVCSLREQGRIAIPGVYRLEQVMAHLRSRSQDYALTVAQHSRLGSLGADFITNGGSVDLVAGDVLDLTYQPAPETQTDAASWYLLVRRLGTTNPIPFSQRRTPEASLPLSFALRQNEPNPSGITTVIRYDLPAASPVRLEVFDLLGRKVATLADGVYPAGFHSLEWNLRDARGAPVRPGVYVYRMAAGEFHARRKMSVLP